MAQLKTENVAIETNMPSVGRQVVNVQKTGAIIWRLCITLWDKVAYFVKTVFRWVFVDCTSINFGILKNHVAFRKYVSGKENFEKSK